MKQPITDMLTKRLFYFYDIKFYDLNIRIEDAKTDGFWLPVEEIKACTVLIFSRDNKNYIAKVTKYTLRVTDIAEHQIRGYIEDCSYQKDSTIEKHKKRLNKLTKEQLKVKAIWGANTGGYNEEKAFFDLGEKEIDGYVLEEEVPFEYNLGEASNIIDFIYKMKRTHKPWKVIQEMEDVSSE